MSYKLSIVKNKMMKRIINILILLCCIASLSSCGNSTEERSRVLKIYNWADYIDEDVLAEFPDWYKQQTGEDLRIIYQVFDINEIMLTKIERGHEDFDVVCPSEYIIERMLRKDLLLPIDRNFGHTPDYIPNVSPYIRHELNKTSQPERQTEDYAVPYMWGTAGILFNKKFITAEEAGTWDILWDSKNRGKILMKDSYRDAYGTAIIYAHARGRKVYLTMNTLPTNEEADRLPAAIKEAAKAGVDAFIVADLGVLDACKTFAPDIDVHLSTQTGITNWAAARAAYKMGAKRVVLAREMTLQDIAILRDKTPPELEIEAFVHGAMCMSVSGRCLLSNYMAGRDANRGQCAQPCRWKYYLSEETRPGQLYEIGENENGSYILNANDLCTAPFIDLICKAGVDSLKIEGRAKTFYYVASVTAAYRKALDAYLADPANDNFELPPEVYAELTRTSHRHYSPGFYFGREQAKQATDSATYIREWEFVGTVDSWENGIAHCQQRGKWSLGDTLEALCPDGRSIALTPEWIENEAGERVESTPHAMEKYTMPTPELPPMSLLRRKTV